MYGFKDFAPLLVRLTTIQNVPPYVVLITPSQLFNSHRHVPMTDSLQRNLGTVMPGSSWFFLSARLRALLKTVVCCPIPPFHDHLGYDFRSTSTLPSPVARWGEGMCFTWKSMSKTTRFNTLVGILCKCVGLARAMSCCVGLIGGGFRVWLGEEEELDDALLK